LNKLLNSKSGKVIQLFAHWKSIPNVKLAIKKKKAIRFESSLHKLANKFLKITYEPMKLVSTEAQNKKRICIYKMIRATQSENIKKFAIWREVVKEKKVLDHAHQFDTVFEIASQHLANQLLLLLKNSGEELSKKRSLCRKLINNSSFIQHHAYFIWKETLQSDNIKIEK
jgi:hypothetical protein